jgi:hypothetical protein
MELLLFSLLLQQKENKLSLKPAETILEILNVDLEIIIEVINDLTNQLGNK